MTVLPRARLPFGLVGLAVVACAAAAPEGAQPAQESPTAWAIEVETSGGFAGTGRGGVKIISEGEVTVSRPRRPRDSAAECRGRLSAEERQNLERAIREIAPDSWHVAGLDVAAPDAFRYALTVELGEITPTAVWHDNTADRLPRDLAAVHLAASAAWSRVAKTCER